MNNVSQEPEIAESQTNYPSQKICQLLITNINAFDNGESIINNSEELNELSTFIATMSNNNSKNILEPLPEFAVILKPNKVFDAGTYFSLVSEKDADFERVYKYKNGKNKLIAENMDDLRKNYDFYAKYISACNVLTVNKKSRSLDRYSLALIYQDKAKNNTSNKESYMKKYAKWVDLAIEDGNIDAYKNKIMNISKGEFKDITFLESLEASELVLKLCTLCEDLSLEERIVYRSILYYALKNTYNQSL
jgi:hypothetical protein